MVVDEGLGRTTKNEGESRGAREKEKVRGVAGKMVPPPRGISVSRPLQREGVAAQTLPKKNRRSRRGKAARAVPGNARRVTRDKKNIERSPAEGYVGGVVVATKRTMEEGG